MNHINTVFHQLLKHIPHYRFDRVVERYEGDRRVRTLNCWTQFVALIYVQLAQLTKQNRNAVLIRITVAIIAYLLVRFVQQAFPNSLYMQQ